MRVGWFRSPEGWVGVGPAGSKVRPKVSVRVGSKIGAGKSSKIGGKAIEMKVKSVNLGSVYRGIESDFRQDFLSPRGRKSNLKANGRHDQYF